MECMRHLRNIYVGQPTGTGASDGSRVCTTRKACARLGALGAQHMPGSHCCPPVHSHLWAPSVFTMCYADAALTMWCGTCAPAACAVLDGTCVHAPCLLRE